jgi:transcriptional regulator with XRE-family HTH domain
MIGLSQRETMPKAKPDQPQARIGRAVRMRRQDLGLSLGDLAGQLGVAVSTVSKLENGLAPITFERLEAISRLLKVDMASLLSGAGAPVAVSDDDAPPAPRREDFGTRRSITRAAQAVPVESDAYTLSFHATDLLEKRFQPIVADVRCRDIKDYGPFTRHAGEEWNYVTSGTLEFHTDIYAPVILEAGDSIYFDAEMGHAHVQVGQEPCILIAMIVPREARSVENGVAPVMEIARRGDPTTPAKRRAVVF